MPPIEQYSLIEPLTAISIERALSISCAAAGVANAIVANVEYKKRTTLLPLKTELALVRFLALESFTSSVFVQGAATRLTPDFVNKLLIERFSRCDNSENIDPRNIFDCEPKG